jgi:hypothetical protein
MHLSHACRRGAYDVTNGVHGRLRAAIEEAIAIVAATYGLHVVREGRLTGRLALLHEW